MTDPTPLSRHVYEVLVKRYQDWVTTGSWEIDRHGLHLNHTYDIDDVTVLAHIYSESAVTLPGSPYHNQYVNLYHLVQDTTPVYVPSRLYVFPDMRNRVSVDINQSECEHSGKNECSVVIYYPTANSINSLLSICNRISQYQSLVALYLKGIDSQELTAADVPIFGTKIQFLWLLENEFQAQFLSNMLYQLSSKCSALETLVMKDTQLHHVEDGLGALFESLAKHHRAKLEIWMVNNNLSELFKRNWEIRLVGLKFHDENYDEDDWLTAEESNWLTKETVHDYVTDKKDFGLKEDENDWLTVEESNWLIRETLHDGHVTDKKDIAWREDDLLDGFYDDVEDEDDAAENEIENEGETEDKEDVH